jgi:hypothetical protein
MQIAQIDLNNKRQVDDFVHLPFSIYKDIPPMSVAHGLLKNHSGVRYKVICNKNFGSFDN